jgi:hypothetical protein
MSPTAERVGSFFVLDDGRVLPLAALASTQKYCARRYAFAQSEDSVDDIFVARSDLAHRAKRQNAYIL